VKRDHIESIVGKRQILRLGDAKVYARDKDLLNISPVMSTPAKNGNPHRQY